MSVDKNLYFLSSSDLELIVGWEQKQHEHGSAAVADASDIFSKLGLTDVNVAEAWEVKK